MFCRRRHDATRIGTTLITTIATEEERDSMEIYYLTMFEMVLCNLMSLYKVGNFHVHIMYFSPVGKVKYMREFIHCRLSFCTCCWQWCCCESIFSSFCADVCVYLAIELFGMPHDRGKCASAKTFYVVRHSWSWFCMQNIPIDAKCLLIQIELVLLQLLYVLQFHSRTFTFTRKQISRLLWMYVWVLL